MFTIILLLCAYSANAWGATGHAVIGYIAEEFLTNKALLIIQKKLGGKGLADVASWADQVKSTPEYGWSRSYHYADAGDSPPTSCGYDDERDCPNGQCLVGAISNYTKQILCSKRHYRTRTLFNTKRPKGFPSPGIHGNEFTENSETVALKFLDHFFGDLSQPLHLCGRDRGGNSDSIRFDEKTSGNLHSIWDSDILEKHIKEEFDNAMLPYASFLINEINYGKFSSMKQSWLSKESVTAVNSLGHLKAIIEWANDSDKLDCSVVWPEFDKNPNQNFGLDYYKNAFPVVNIQIAKAGYRLGMWLNAIFEEC